MPKSYSDDPLNPTADRLRGLADFLMEDGELSRIDGYSVAKLAKQAVAELDMWKFIATNPESSDSKLMVLTRNAYSFARLGAENWLATIQILRFMGFTDMEIEALVRSKHMSYMEWHGDGSDPRSFRATAKDYFQKAMNDKTLDLDEITKHTPFRGVYDDDGNYLTEKKGG